MFFNNDVSYIHVIPCHIFTSNIFLFVLKISYIVLCRVGKKDLDVPEDKTVQRTMQNMSPKMREVFALRQRDLAMNKTCKIKQGPIGMQTIPIFLLKQQLQQSGLFAFRKKMENQKSIKFLLQFEENCSLFQIKVIYSVFISTYTYVYTKNQHYIRIFLWFARKIITFRRRNPVTEGFSHSFSQNKNTNPQIFYTQQL